MKCNFRKIFWFMKKENSWKNHNDVVEMKWWCRRADLITQRRWKTIRFAKFVMQIENKMITSSKFTIYNHKFVSLKMMIKSLNSFQAAFVERCVFIIVFKFTIFISVLWWLWKYGRMIEKTMSVIQNTNFNKIFLKLFYENEMLTSDDSMLINVILFCFVFLWNDDSYDLFAWWWRKQRHKAALFLIFEKFWF